MRSAGPRSFFVILVFQLYAEDGTAVFPKLAFDLAANLSVPAVHIFQIFGVVAAQRNLLFEEPVWKTAIARFAVIPRPNPQIHIETVACAQRDEVSQIALARPVKLSFHFLVMNPKNVRGDDLHATGFHLQDLFLPILLRKAREMKLAHHRKPRFAVIGKVLAVDFNAMSSGRHASQVQEAGLRRRCGHGGVNAHVCRHVLCADRGRKGEKQTEYAGGTHDLHGEISSCLQCASSLLDQSMLAAAAACTTPSWFPRADSRT